MIRTEYLWVNIGLDNFVFETSGNNKVVNAPTNISSPGVGEMAPPGVMSITLME